MNNQPLFEGITYRREIRHQPRPIILHVVTVDLDAPGIGFLVTPKDALAGFDYQARTTSQFLQAFNLQVAVNGDFFDPWRDNGPWDYYPHVGDGVNARGYTVSRGEVVTQGYAPDEHSAAVYITADNRVTFEAPEAADIYNAVSGLTLLRDGAYNASWGDDAYLQQPHPRTVVALDQTGRTLLLMVVDGRQPNYSEGITLPELAELVIELGGYDAINLDGGGSATLVMAGENGEPVQLGSAIHTRIPARERPVANHLGIYAETHH